MSELPVIAIDGPSGSGKGTVSSALANKLGWHWLDSGAFYRILALWVDDQHLDLGDLSALHALAMDLPVEMRLESGHIHYYLNKMDVSDRLRDESCGRLASQVATIVTVRDALLIRFRKFKQVPGLVADGRDMGTIVFPEADLKIFLTASAEIRAKRRWKQLREQGVSANLANLCEEMRLRDVRDRTRAVAPLVPAPDAIVLDTDDLAADQVLCTVLDLWNKHKKS